MKKSRKIRTSASALKIVGLILSESYQKCKIFAQKLRKHHPTDFQEPSTKGFLEVDWLDYLNKLRKEIGGQAWAQEKGAVVFVGDKFIGGEEELFHRFRSYLYKNPTAEEIRNSAKQEYMYYLDRNKLLYTYFDLSLDGEYMGTLLFELRSDLLPKTCAWFALLCDPENYMGYSYKGSRVHRVSKSGWFQVGDLVIPEKGFLEDESYSYKHDRRGILSFAKDGKNTNRCQFLVTFKPSGWMDEYYVAFGRLVEGADVLRRIEYTKSIYESPIQEIKIDNCGLAKVGLGRSYDTKLKMKGLTVGEPHVHLETFMDLVFDQFCNVLFDRLDVEVKRRFYGEWIGKMLWERVQAQLSTREPIGDNTDINDASSQQYLPVRYLAGLYGLREIPDHYIMEMLNKVIEATVERSDTNKMAESIVNLILKNIDVYKLKLVSSGHDPDSEAVVSNLLQYLIKNVNKIIFGSNFSSDTDTMSHEQEEPECSPLKTISEDADIQLNLSNLQKKPPSSHSHHVEGRTEIKLEERLSAKDAVVKYILDTLLNIPSRL